MMMEVIKLIVTGLVGGLSATYISGRTHRQKNLWDLKFAAYKDLIESLSDMKNYYLNFGCYISNVTSGEKGEQPGTYELNKCSEGYERLRTSVDYGSFLFSEDVVSALNTLFSELPSMDSIASLNEDEDSLSSCYEKTGNCLNAVIRFSKLDLELTPSLKSVLANWRKFLTN